MKYFYTSLRRAANIAERFKRSDNGSLSVEAVLVAPLLLFGLLFCYTYFAAFQVKSSANKAAYTISDYLSRQTEPVDEDFIDGLADIYGFLTNNGNKTLRISSFAWSDADGAGDYDLQWSYAPYEGTKLTSETISSVQSRLPVLSSGETVLIVETTTNWAPIFNVGLDVLTFPDFVATKPRFATQVLFDGADDGSDNSEADVDVEETYGGNRKR